MAGHIIKCVASLSDIVEGSYLCISLRLAKFLWQFLLVCLVLCVQERGTKYITWCEFDDCSGVCLVNIHLQHCIVLLLQKQSAKQKTNAACKHLKAFPSLQLGDQKTFELSSRYSRKLARQQTKKHKTRKPNVKTKVYQR